ETTEGREGFVHPVKITGTTAEAELRFIVRDFDTQKLEEHVQLLRGLADDLAAEEPRAQVTVSVEESYHNMKEFLDAAPAVTEAAQLLDERQQRGPVVRQRVLDARRRLGVAPAEDQLLVLECAEPFGERARADAGARVLELGKAAWPLGEVVNEQRRPLGADDLGAGGDRAGRRLVDRVHRAHRYPDCSRRPMQTSRGARRA